MPTLCGSRPRGVSDRRGESAENVAGWVKVLEREHHSAYGLGPMNAPAQLGRVDAVLAKGSTRLGP